MGHLHMHRSFAFACVLIFGVSATAVAQKAETPKLVKRTFTPNFDDQAVAVGDVEEFEFQISETVKQEMIPPEGESRKRTVSLEARGRGKVRVAELMEKKLSKRAEVIFSKIEFRASEDDDFQTLSCEGVTIDVVMWPEVKLSRNDGVDLTPIETKVLQMMFNKTDPDAATSNEMFAPKAPVEVGETWSIDSDRFLDASRRSAPPGVGLSGGDGQMALVAITRANGKEFLKVQGTATASIDSLEGLDDGRGTVKFEFGGELPMDGKGSRNTTTTRQRLTIEASRQGLSLHIFVDSKRSYKTVWPKVAPKKTPKVAPKKTAAPPKSKDDSAKKKP